MSRGVAIVKVGKEPILLWEEVLLAHYWLLRRQMQISRGDDALKNGMYINHLPKLEWFLSIDSIIDVTSKRFTWTVVDYGANSIS